MSYLRVRANKLAPIYLSFETFFPCNYLEDRVSVPPLPPIPWQAPAQFQNAAVYNHSLYQQIPNLYFICLVNNAILIDH
jgi:hypothetical protein